MEEKPQQFAMFGSPNMYSYLSCRAHGGLDRCAVWAGSVCSMCAVCVYLLRFCQLSSYDVQSTLI